MQGRAICFCGRRCFISIHVALCLSAYCLNPCIILTGLYLDASGRSGLFVSLALDPDVHHKGAVGLSGEGTLVLGG